MQLINRGADSYEFRMRNGSMMGLRAGNVSFWFGVKNNRLYFTNDYNLVDTRVILLYGIVHGDKKCRESVVLLG